MLAMTPFFASLLFILASLVRLAITRNKPREEVKMDEITPKVDWYAIGEMEIELYGGIVSTDMPEDIKDHFAQQFDRKAGLKLQIDPNAARKATNGVQDVDYGYQDAQYRAIDDYGDPLYPDSDY